MLKFLLVVTLAVMVSARPQSEEEEGADLPVPPALIALGLLCGNNQIAPQVCTCAAGGTFPNQIKDLVGCNPTECRCPGKQWKTLEIFGCKLGGMPR